MLFTIAAAVTVQRGLLVEISFDHGKLGHVSSLDCDEGCLVVGDGLILVKTDSTCTARLSDYDQTISFPVKLEEVVSGSLYVEEKPEHDTLFGAVAIVIFLFLSRLFSVLTSCRPNSMITVGFVDGQSPLSKIQRGSSFDDCDLTELALHHEVAYVIHLDDLA